MIRCPPRERAGKGGEVGCRSPACPHHREPRPGAKAWQGRMPAPVVCLNAACSPEGNSPPPEATRHVDVFFIAALSKEQEKVRSIMKRLKVHLFVGVVAAVLLALLLAPAVAQAQAAWSVVPSPSPGPSVNDLNGVASISANDVWAVGDFINASGASQTLIEHWNGTQWSIVASPNPSAFHNVLRGVTAISTNDVWAVGWFNNAQDIPRTLIEHWNGSSWSVVTSPNGGTRDNVLNGVTVVSATDVWAVGDFLDSTSTSHTLIEHWNGKKWSVVASQNPVTGSNTLDAVQAVSASDVWAVGQTSTQTLIEQWNGTQWSVVASPNLTGNNLLRGVAIVSASDIWAVGFVISSVGEQTLIEQ